MSDEQPLAGKTCSSCGTQLPLIARFCSSCGLPAKAAVSDPVAFVDESTADGETRAAGGSATTAGGAQRQGSPQWLAIVGAACVVVMAWLLFRTPPVDQAVGSEDSPTSAPVTTVESPVTTTVVASQIDSVQTTDRPTSTGLASSLQPNASPLPTERVDLGRADVSTIDGAGWRLIVGDGHHVEVVDLRSGLRERIENVGAPIAIVEDRIIVYRAPDLLSVPALGDSGGAELIARVPALQEMYTRARSSDSPVVVDDGRSIWWPNNNSSPQTWIKLDLVTGEVLDEMALTAEVYGGPEVVSTLGSGTFERVDGRWEPLGDMFASSASPQAILGQRCTSPDNCRWLLQDRATGRARPALVEVAGPFEATLIAAAERPLILLSDRVFDPTTGRSSPLVVANPLEVVATNRAALLAVAGGGPSGASRSSVTIYNLDLQTQTRIEFSALRSDWLLLDQR